MDIFRGQNLFTKNLCFAQKCILTDRIKRIHKRSNPFPKIWLDVGCAGGGMLKVAKVNGYKVEGVEPGKKAAQYVSKQLDIKIHPTILDEANLEYSKYGIISYFHVLEHIPNPLEELKKVKKYLHNRGFLVIEIPDFGAFSWKLMRKKHRHLSKGHIYYFTKNSITNLLENNGFKILLIENVPYFVSLSWYIHRFANSMVPMEMIKRLFLSASSLFDGKELVVRTDLRDVLFVIAQIN